MKLLLACLLSLAVPIYCRNRIETLKSHIDKGDQDQDEQEKTFAASLVHMFMFDEQDDDRFTVKLSDQAMPMAQAMPANSQVRTWNAITEKSPMTRSGFSHWMATPTGFLFQKTSGERSLCENENKVVTADHATTMSFKCKKLEEKPADQAPADPDAVKPEAGAETTAAVSDSGTARFKEKKMFPVGGYGGLGYGGVGMGGLGMMGGMGMGPCMGMGLGMSGCSTWMPTTGGMPYGGFNYDYYSVNNMGYYGCPSLVGGYCGMTPSFYPYM